MHYGGVRALHDVDLALREAQITCIIGGNGAGKSTLLDVLSGHRAPDDGRVFLRGDDVTRTRLEARAQRGIVRLFQYGTGFRGLRIPQSVAVGLRSTNLRPFELPAQRSRRIRRVRALLEMIGFDPDDDRRVRNASFGQQRRVALAGLLASEPNVFLIDEPTAGLDPRIVGEMSRMLLGLKERGYTIGLVEHNLPFVREVGDSVYLMERGAVVKVLDPQDVFDDPDVQLELLGGVVDA